MSLAYDDGWAKLYIADATRGLAALPAESVHTCVTSPPYHALRSYLPADHSGKRLEIGTEPTVAEYVTRLVAVFDEVWRVLRSDGTAWVNLGDRYLPNKQLAGVPWRFAFAMQDAGWILRSAITWIKPNPMPESVTDRPTQATEMVYLFSKKPRYFYDAEAVKEKGQDWGPRDRTHSKHNTNGFHAAGQPPHKGLTNGDASGGRNLRNYWQISTRPFSGSHYAVFPPELPERCIKAGTSEKGVCSECGAPWRRVVERTAGFTDGRCNGCGKERGKHKQGAASGLRAQEWHSRPESTTMEGDGAVPCGAGRTIGFEPTCSHFEKPDLPASYKGSSFDRGKTGSRDGGDRTQQGGRSEKTFKGWEPACEHGAEVVPATVLDPFSGSGTTLLVARKLGRRSIGIDLDARNTKLLEERMGDQGVLC